MKQVARTHLPLSVKKTKPVLLFDIDGTLLITGGASDRAYERAFYELFGVKNALQGITPDGKTDPLIAEETYKKKVLKKNKLSKKIPKNIIDKILSLYTNYLPITLSTSRKFRVLKGVRELLPLVKDYSHLGILTGNTEKGAKLKLKHAGIYHHFSFGAYGSDSKKRELLVNVAIKRLKKIRRQKISKKDIYIIGDTPRDIIAGKLARVKVIAVASGSYSSSELKRAGAEYVLNSLADKKKFLKIVGIWVCYRNCAN